MVPPDPIPNSVVKRNRADDSVGSPHVKVGHRQAPNLFHSISEKKQDNADMAQSVERILGKDEVPSSILGISTIFKPDLSGDNSIVVPPDPIPNSVVKRNRADDSVGSPHVKVGHFQTLN